MNLPRIAFKEWAAIVLALERGLQDIVLRRGEIAEERDAFEACHDRFLLLPTYYRQQRDGLRAPHRELFVEALRSQPPTGFVRIDSFAEVLDVHLLGSEAELASFTQRHVYEDWVLRERLDAQRGRALQLLEVRVHRLPIPLKFHLEVEYGGHQNWVPLSDPRAATGAS
ncbi:MAG: DUF1802 family protein [Polyangiaceae bacterium]|nr:DUF1802 family protein [Polyangiaceae bacterium]